MVLPTILILIAYANSEVSDMHDLLHDITRAFASQIQRRVIDVDGQKFRHLTPLDGFTCMLK